MRVLATLTRLYVSPGALDAAIAFHAALHGVAPGQRFALPGAGLELARVGPVLLVAGEEAALAPFRGAALTMAVDSLAEAEAWLVAHGAAILRPRTEVPTGWNLHVRHLDGTEAEYVELRARA